jgi:hypothetical protein
MRDLASRVPTKVKTDLAAAVTVLERYGPAVCGALTVLQRATTDACHAAEMRVASLDPAETAEPTEAELAALEAVLGLDRGWAAAFHVVDAVEAVHA